MPIGSVGTEIRRQPKERQPSSYLPDIASSQMLMKSATGRHKDAAKNERIENTAPTNKLADKIDSRNDEDQKTVSRNEIIAATDEISATEKTVLKEAPVVNASSHAQRAPGQRKMQPKKIVICMPYSFEDLNNQDKTFIREYWLSSPDLDDE